MLEEERLRKRLTELENAKTEYSKLRTLTSYTDKEKCEKFDKLFKLAQEIMTSKFKGEEMKDADHWCFEEVLKLLGKEVWDVYNKL